jgi:hypothetical protein
MDGQINRRTDNGQRKKALHSDAVSTSAIRYCQRILTRTCSWVFFAEISPAKVERECNSPICKHANAQHGMQHSRFDTLTPCCSSGRSVLEPEFLKWNRSFRPLKCPPTNLFCSPSLPALPPHNCSDYCCN